MQMMQMKIQLLRTVALTAFDIAAETNRGGIETANSFNSLHTNLASRQPPLERVLWYIAAYIVRLKLRYNLFFCLSPSPPLSPLSLVSPSQPHPLRT